jgi:hypothetical protein
MPEKQMRELRDGRPFPVEVTAYDAGRVDVNGNYRFGIDKDRTIALIRELADRIESGQLLLQGVESRHKLAVDDFTVSSWVIDVAQRNPHVPEKAQ